MSLCARSPASPLARSKLCAGAVGALALLAFTPAALAVRTVVWTETPRGLQEGLAESVSFTSKGGLVLAPRIEDLSATAANSKDRAQEAIAEPIVWCEALDSDGNLLLGTGHSGRIVRVTPKGEVSTLAELPESEVTALLVSPSGTVFAGSSPNGALYRIAKGGKPEVIYEGMDERYIWALAQDANGNLYAGTGERGKIFRISPKGEGSVLYDSLESHITALLVDRSDALLAGTAGTGLVYRIEPGKSPTVLYQSNFAEIASLSIDPAGQIYAASVAAGAGEIPAPAMRLRVLPAEEEPKPGPAGEGVAPGRPREPGRERPKPAMEAEFEGPSPPDGSSGPLRAGGGCVVKIAPGGSTEEVWKSSDEVPYALAATPDGFVYLGTGEPARLLHLEESGKASVVARFPQAQLSSLAVDRGGRLFAATSNSGAAYRIEHQLAESGTYQSPVRDAGARARWGRIQWDGSAGAGQKIEIQTRAGNSAFADETWSPWSPAYADPEGSEIVNPSGRYIQWRARLVAPPTGISSPLLRSVSVSYLPQNRSPHVQEVKVLSFRESHEDSEKPAERSSRDANGSESAASTASTASTAPTAAGPAGAAAASRSRAVVWQAEDPDDDRLTYRLFLQKEGEETWRSLATDITESRFSLDEKAWPEGRCRVKVVASDAPANTVEDAREAEGVSESTVLDYSPPILEILTGRLKGGTTVQIRATDTLTPIDSATLLTGDRQVGVARPVDGVLDSKNETLIIDLPANFPPKGLRLRVRDGAGNETLLDLAPDHAPEPGLK